MKARLIAPLHDAGGAAWVSIARSSRSPAPSCEMRRNSHKPERDRLQEYRDARRQSLELQLFSSEPIYPDFETLKLADWLTWLSRSCETISSS